MDSLVEGDMDSNFRYRGKKALDFRSIPGIAGYRRALKRYQLIVRAFFFCGSNHSIEPGGRKRRRKAERRARAESGNIGGG